MINLIPFPYKLLALFLLILGAFAFGYKKGDSRAEIEINKYSVQIMTLQNQLKEKQVQIVDRVVTEYVDKVQVVKQKEIVYVKQAADTVPAQYNLSNGWVYLHDTSAQGGDADTSRSSDASSSDVKDNQALATIISNYSICQQNAQQLVSLQDYVHKVKEAVDKANKSVHK
jgi:hypothetical protein